MPNSQHKTITSIMKNYLMITLIALFVFTSKASKLDVFFEQTDVFLKKTVKNGLVNYAQVKAHKGELQKLIDEIEVMNVTKEANARNEAFYINAYNLIVIYNVTRHYPIEGPLKIDGFFDKKKHKIAGDFITLNDIENEKLRKVYKDPRLHFVLVCAAKGCPKITNFAYRPATLSKKLDQQTKKAVNDPNFIRVKTKSGKVLVSEIFKWYKVDFVKGDDFQPLISFLNKYRAEGKTISKDLTVGFYPYNWQLNDLKK